MEQESMRAFEAESTHCLHLNTPEDVGILTLWIWLDTLERGIDVLL